MAKAHNYIGEGGHHTEKTLTGKGGHHTYFLNGGNNWGGEEPYTGLGGTLHNTYFVDWGHRTTLRESK